MTVSVTALGTLEGVEVRQAPVAGAVWDRGALLRLDGGRVAWSFPLDEPPRLAVVGRRLYVASGFDVVCLDLRTGAQVWALEAPGAVTAIDANPDGVDVCVDTSIVTYDVYGGEGPTGRLPGAARLLRRVGPIRYVATGEGIFRVPATGRPTLLHASACLALFDREGALQALAEGPSGTLLVEDHGVPLVWPFPQAERHWIAPWGRAEWAVLPREGQGGVWVVDRRVQARWQVPLPGVARGLAVAGRAVGVLIDDGGPALAVTHPDVSGPLLLALDGGDALHGDGSVFYLTHGGATTMFLVREA